jgi:hypothetical protein
VPDPSRQKFRDSDFPSFSAWERIAYKKDGKMTIKKMTIFEFSEKI